MNEHNHMNHNDMVSMQSNNKMHNHENHHFQQKHQSQHSEANHNHHAMMINDFRKRFFISLILTIPILILSPMIQMFIGVDWRFSNDLYILFIFSTILFVYGSKPFLTGAIKEIKEKGPAMMTLIALATSVAYIYSSFTVFFLEGNDLFWELATLLDIMLLGHWIEMKSVMGASRALKELVKLLPSVAHLINNKDETIDVEISKLKKGDKVLVKPGEKIPVDAVVIKGTSSVNESMLTGESVPIEKKENDKVIGGSINGEGSLTILVEKMGDETYLSQVIKLVKEAQENKSKLQDLSNRVAKWLFYVALFSGSITLIIWLIIGKDIPFAVERMVTVMVIACPHALGLAIPLVIAKSTAISATSGLLIKNRTNFEQAYRINAIIFDKTGTLTEGKFGITDIVLENFDNEENLLSIAASLENQSQHPIAKGIVNEAQKRNIKITIPDNFSSITGVGIKGIIKGKEVLITSPAYVKNNNFAYPNEAYDKLVKEGKTTVFVIINNMVAGMIGLADIIKKDAYEAIADIKKTNIKSILLTGDNYQVARWVGDQLGIDDVYAEVLPHQKAEKIKEVKAKGFKVAMTGDGVNDAPSLALADLGIAVGAGTDVAIETADVILVKSNPSDVLSIIELSRKTYKKMIQNIWFGTGYNIIAIPLAAGILYNFGIVLSPALGAVLMSLSTIIVSINAQLLKK